MRIVLLILVTVSLAVSSHAAAPIDVTCPSRQPAKACPETGGDLAGILSSTDHSCSGQAVVVTCAAVLDDAALKVRPHMLASDRLEGMAGGGIERPPRARDA